MSENLVGLLACRPSDNVLSVVGEVAAVVSGGLFLKLEPGRKYRGLMFFPWDELATMSFVTHTEAGKWGREIERKWEARRVGTS